MSIVELVVVMGVSIVMVVWFGKIFILDGGYLVLKLWLLVESIVD